MWTEKAAQLGKTVLMLKTWYSSMRTRYGRLKKNKSGDGDKEMTERDVWVIKNFEFLHPHIHEVQKKTLVSMKKKLAASDGLMSISGDELDENTDALSSTTTQSCAPSKRKARKET
ncbi:uncharacterized protein LOC144620814 [Crassostrea virginica]